VAALLQKVVGMKPVGCMLATSGTRIFSFAALKQHRFCAKPFTITQKYTSSVRRGVVLSSKHRRLTRSTGPDAEV